MIGANKLKVSVQIAAEKDRYLIDCFLDNGVINDLIDNRFEIIAGRKGTGKTAIAQYLQKRYEDYGIDFAARLTLSDLYGVDWDYNTLTADSLVKLLLVRTAQKLLDKDMLTDKGSVFWKDYLTSHGLQNVTNFNDWIAKAKKMLESKSAGVGVTGIAKGDLKHTDEIVYERQLFDESSSTLATRLSESIKEDKKIVIVVDDLTDHLDHSSPEEVDKGLEQIKLVLHWLSGYNSKFSDDEVDLVFICTIRDDLWEFIHGSNENKLKHNCLWLNWTEENFCKLLIKRLPHFNDNQEEALAKPIKSIKTVFPDEVFEKLFEVKNIKKSEIKMYSTVFYAYVQLVSFNRPRDFLRLCFALQKRLSTTKPVELTHILAAEREYEMYFYNELKDELNIFSKKFSLKNALVHKLLKTLSSKSSISYPEFKQMISITVKSSHSHTQSVIRFLWRYSLIGYTHSGGYARFKHNSPVDHEHVLPEENELKNYSFVLHRGIFWTLNNGND